MTLLYRIERHLRRSAITATAFGRKAMNDPGFVRHLRNGREPTPKTEARVLAFIEASQRGCATVEEDRACAG
jgi:tRNA-dihydrouridine synthase